MCIMKSKGSQNCPWGGPRFIAPSLNKISEDGQMILFHVFIFYQTVYEPIYNQSLNAIISD